MMDVAPLRGRGLKLPGDAQDGAIRGRSLTGAWIETTKPEGRQYIQAVAPLRGRGLKLQLTLPLVERGLSLPYGGVD